MKTLWNHVKLISWLTACILAFITIVGGFGLLAYKVAWIVLLLGGGIVFYLFIYEMIFGDHSGRAQT